MTMEGEQIRFDIHAANGVELYDARGEKLELRRQIGFRPQATVDRVVVTATKLDGIRNARRGRGK